MTEEEARAEAEEARRLSAEIHRLERQIARAVIEKNHLQAELATLVRNVEALTQNAKNMDIEVNQSMEYIKNRITQTDVSTTELFALVDDLSNVYFTFKNLSSASKNVTRLTDEYYTRFRFFNELRRIALGYVIGLDAHICSEENIRKKVERVYLQNTEYWLAYAMMAVMLWANDEEEAAKRAMSKALSMEYLSSSLFFLLINLRFTRMNAAKQWYLSYLDRVDTEKLGREWQYLLQAYLSGTFGVDKEFNRLVNQYFTHMLEQMESMHPNYGNKIVSRTLQFSNTYIHVTENEFETLRRYCTEYKELKGLLSDAEKNEVLAVYFRTAIESESIIEDNMFQRIENILYDLINAYDKEEFKVIKDRRHQEMIIKAKGDLGLAQQFYNTEFPNESTTKSLDDLLFEWGFEEDLSQVDGTVKKFAISYLKKWIAKGFQAFAQDYRKKEKEAYSISIDGWQKTCSENSYVEAKEELIKHYNQNRVWNILKDKYIIIFIGMILASLFILIITAIHFNKIALVIGILLGVIGAFLLWRRIVDMEAVLRAKKEQGCQILKKAIEELGAWRKLYQLEDNKNIDLVNVFENINS